MVLSCHRPLSGGHERPRHAASCCCRCCVDIVEHHIRGTRFGIGVDPADGLLRQGQEGYQLTWMDAKVGDWVVTPRRGKAVEINALWYNALRLLGWLAERGRSIRAGQRRSTATPRGPASRSTSRFWCAERGWLYDVVDTEGPDDASLRPNQLFAISLDHPVLAQSALARGRRRRDASNC